MRFLTLAAAAVVIACSGAGTAEDAPVSQAGAPSPTEVAAVQRSLDSALALFAAALKKSDAVGMAAILANDAIVMAPGMKAARGRDEIIAGYNGMLSSMSVTEVTFKALDVTVAGNYAIETGAYDMVVQPKTGKSMRDTGKYVSVWRREADGSWKMIRDIFNTDLAM